MEKQQTPHWINSAAEDIYVHAATDHDGFVRDATEIIAKHAPKGQQGATWQPITEVPREIIENKTPIVVMTSQGLQLVKAVPTMHGYKRFETIPGNWAVIPTHWLADMPDPPVNMPLLKETK